MAQTSPDWSKLVQADQGWACPGELAVAQPGPYPDGRDLARALVGPDLDLAGPRISLAQPGPGLGDS